MDGLYPLMIAKSVNLRCNDLAQVVVTAGFAKVGVEMIKIMATYVLAATLLLIFLLMEVC